MSEVPTIGAVSEAGAAVISRKREQERRSRKRWTRRRVLSQFLANGIPALLIFAWWRAAPGQPEYLLPGLGDVASRVFDLVAGDLAVHTATSFARILLAVVLALVLGTALIVLTEVAPVTDTAVSHRFLPLLDSVPGIGWAILGVIWFGVSNTAVVFVVTLILLPFAMVNTREGMKAIDPELREMGKSFTRSRLALLRMIELPLLLPYVLASVRLSFSVGWKVALIAEFFGAETGIGLIMNQARQNFDTATVFATLITVLIIVAMVDRFVFEPAGYWLARRSGTGGAHHA